MNDVIPQICYCCRWWKREKPSDDPADKNQFGACHVWPFTVEHKHLMDGCSLWQESADATPQSRDVVPQWQVVSDEL